MTDRDAALTAWWAEPLGRALLAAESELLAAALEDVFGWELLQVGAWGGARELLAGSRTRRQSVGAGPGRAGGDDASCPCIILRVVDRWWGCEGQLLVLGFHPWTLCGMRPLWIRTGFPPGM